MRYFYPRPPRGGRPVACAVDYFKIRISIHALREEGDPATGVPGAKVLHFYPRPPRGGRHRQRSAASICFLFLSTPSARRATLDSWHYGDNYKISIHALREEGDQDQNDLRKFNVPFLSTPSARRATRFKRRQDVKLTIFLSTPSARRATSNGNRGGNPQKDFYPRPPRGGRLGQDDYQNFLM